MSSLLIGRLFLAYRQSRNHLGDHRCGCGRLYCDGCVCVCVASCCLVSSLSVASFCWGSVLLCDIYIFPRSLFRIALPFFLLHVSTTLVLSIFRALALFSPSRSTGALQHPRQARSAGRRVRRRFCSCLGGRFHRRSRASLPYFLAPQADFYCRIVLPMFANHTAWLRRPTSTSRTWCCPPAPRYFPSQLRNGSSLPRESLGTYGTR